MYTVTRNASTDRDVWQAELHDPALETTPDRPHAYPTYLAVFAGRDAESRAREYAAWKNLQFNLP